MYPGQRKNGKTSIDNTNYFDCSAAVAAESAALVQPLQARKKDSIIINMGDSSNETKYIPHRIVISNEY